MFYPTSIPYPQSQNHAWTGTWTESRMDGHMDLTCTVPGQHILKCNQSPYRYLHLRSYKFVPWFQKCVSSFDGSAHTFTQCRIDTEVRYPSIGGAVCYVTCLTHVLQHAALLEVMNTKYELRNCLPLPELGLFSILQMFYEHLFT